MSLFKDKVYEEMDDISKLIEPYQYSLNDDLAQFPDEVEITRDHMQTQYSFSVRDVVRSKAKELELYNLVDKVWEVGESFFEFKIYDSEGEVAESIDYDFKNNKMNGRILLVKKKAYLGDADIVGVIKKTIEDKFYSGNNTYDSKRINEIADLFNDNTVKKQRSIRKKVRHLSRHLAALIDSRKIDIRDVGLASRFVDWIILYIKDGNLPALANITKLKIMTHNNRPIYSIDEKVTL